MLFVIVESPYAGEVEANEAYARRALHHSLVVCGEAPFASHLLYTQPGVLDDLIPDERQHGIDAGLELAKRADLSAFYVDRGISRGMKYGLASAIKNGRPVEIRSLYGLTLADWHAILDRDCVPGEEKAAWLEYELVIG
jgi:hypothetical protein